MNTFVPAAQPTIYFIGVTTGSSSIMKVFPKWAKALHLDDAVIKGMDFTPHSDPQLYREAVEFIKNDPLSLGALVTTHKIDLFKACKDMFEYIDPFEEYLKTLGPDFKIASGGELSRIMLSLKALMARFEGMPTLIFDEIDTGVSGSVAARMGQMICRMGETMQVFSITHLPQVAAKGTAHYLVSKTFDAASGVSTSGITLLQGEARVQEIARLLSGKSITAEAVANARALLNEGV